MAAAGDILVRTLAAARGQGPRGRHHRRARRRRREVHPLPGRRRRRSRATAASRARSAPRPTRWSCTASPGPTASSAATSSRVDVGVVLDGWVADAARTFAVGPGHAGGPQAAATSPRRRCSTPSSSAAPGNRLGDVSHAVQTRVEAEGLSVVRSLVGHGIGRDMHEDPQVPNYGEPGAGPQLEEGMVLAVEPMVTAGRHARAHGRRRLGDLLPGRLAGGPFRVHGRGHRRRSADPHALARGRRRRPPA